MAKRQPVYTREFRRQMVELVRAGRSPEELSREFEPTAQSIRNWVAQSDRDAGRGDGGLRTAEREELNRLRRENRQLQLEREILSKAAAWFARETNVIPTQGFRFVRSPGTLSNCDHVPAARRLPERLVRVVEAPIVAAVEAGCGIDHSDPCRAHRIAWHLWRAARSCRTCGQWYPYWPQAGCASDVAIQDCRCEPATVRHHDGQGWRP